MDGHLPFADRADAGLQLVAPVRRLKLSDPVIVALPRGGVPVARELAMALEAPLELLLVRKLGAPGQPEFALGAVVDGAAPLVLMNEDVVRVVRPTDAYIADETRRQLTVIAERRRQLLGDRPPLPLAGREIVVVDDGVATGATLRVALKAIRLAAAKRVVAAIPVAPRDAIKVLRGEADEVVCLATPEPFFAVGDHYRDFAQVSDDEVAAILAEVAEQHREGGKPPPA